jgi:CRISPR type III-A-associated RAMP protein Csm4
VAEPGIVFLDKPIFQNERWKYNDVFTKELYLYGNGYFIAENSNKFVNAAIMLLNDLGISGRRNSGKGAVSIVQSAYNIKTGFQNPGFYILLSSYIPDEDSIKSIDFSKSRYNIETFQGKNINGIPIGPFRYIKPGSILYIKDKIKGKTYSDESGIMIFNPVIKGVPNESQN